MLGSLTLSDKVAPTDPMPRQPPEIPRKEFDGLAQKTEESRKAIRRTEADVGELKNKLAGIEKNQESHITKRSILVAVPIIIGLLAIIVARDSFQRNSKDQSLEESIRALRGSVAEYGGQITKSNERLVKVESTLEVLLSTVLKDLTKGTTAQVKTKLGVAEEFLKEANKRKLTLDSTILRESGTDLLRQDAVFNNQELAPTAWGTAYQFANYQAFLSSNAINPISPGEVIRMDVYIPEGEHREFQENLFENVTVRIDRGTFKNNVFRNCVIVYAGGPTVLDSNRFIDTQIRPIRDESGRAFLIDFLKGTTLRTGPPMSQH